MNRPTQLLSSQSRLRQEQALARTDAAGRAADQAIGTVWRRLRSLAGEKNRDPSQLQTRARDLLRRLAASVTLTLHSRLRGLAWWGWQSAQASLAAALSPRYLAAAVAQRRWTLREERGEEEAFLDLLFPAPTEAAILQLMGTGWQEQLARATRLASPETLAGILATGYAAGKTQQEIARDLLPAVDGVRVSARRVARTEGLRIAHQAQMAAHDALGDLVAGYSIHATLDANTRPTHRARSGLSWRRDSGVPMQVALRMEAGTLPDDYN